MSIFTQLKNQGYKPVTNDRGTTLIYPKSEAIKEAKFLRKLLGWKTRVVKIVGGSVRDYGKDTYFLMYKGGNK